MTDFLEKTLEQIICETDPEKLKSRGLNTNKAILIRQFNLGSYGIVDIIGVGTPFINLETNRRTIIIDIYELKLNKICVNALMQSARYVSGLESFVVNNFDNSNTDIVFKITLVGKEMETNGDFVFLTDFIPNVRCFTYKYDFDGIKFIDQCGFTFSNPQYPKNLKKTISTNMRTLCAFKNL